MIAFKGSDLKARILTALFLAPIALFAVYVGGLPFALLIALVAAVHNWEWNTVFPRGSRHLRFVSPLLVALAVILFSVFGFKIAGIVIFLSCLGLLACAHIMRPAPAFGYLYSALWALCAIAFRESESYGLVVVFFIVLLVWSFDIAGYFFGKTFGGPKLWPAVSPKKTWSGFLGGLLAASFICLILGLKHTEIHPLSIIFVGLCLVIAAQVGDLFESAIKRHLNVKDSSSILPGHGGMMDRIDGLIAAVLMAFIIATINNSANGLAHSLMYFTPA